MKKSLLLKGLCAITCTFLMAAPNAAYAKTQELQESDTLYHDISYEEELEEAYNVLTLGDLENVKTDLVLPDSYGIHVNISWSSSNENVIDLKGHVVTPEENDETVILTAELSSTKTDSTKTKTFNVQVKKTGVDEILENEAVQVKNYIDYILNDGYTLPDSDEIKIRSQLTWEINSGEVVIEDGVLKKNDKSKERQPLELKALLSYKGESKEITLKNLTLLDKYEAYILSYFAGKNESKEMYIAYSYDGVHWMRLNKADAVLTPKKGNKQIRDPFIMRKKDGSFSIFATNGWTSPMITIWDSDNLTEFENERLCKVSEKGGVASGFYAWAPECNYDPVTDEYMVYWSDPQANDGVGQTYYNTSSDLMNFSKAGVLFEREFFIIDASIKKYKGDYYMVYDDATGDNDTGNGGRRIYIAKAESLQAGAFYPYSGVLSEGVAEGPFLLHNFKDDSWTVYYDYYSKHKFGSATIGNITESEWNYEGISESMPWDEVRHGGGIAVTAKELERILEKWSFDSPEVLEAKNSSNVEIEKGVKLTEDVMPQSVETLLSDGDVVEIPVKWNIQDVNTDKTGSVKITGEFEDNAISFENPDKITPEVTLVVKENKVPTGLIVAAVGVVGVFVALIFYFVVIKRRNSSKEKKTGTK